MSEKGHARGAWHLRLMAEAFANFAESARAMTGLADMDEAWLEEVWQGADRDANI